MKILFKVSCGFKCAVYRNCVWTSAIWGVAVKSKPHPLYWQILKFYMKCTIYCNEKQVCCIESKKSCTIMQQSIFYCSNLISLSRSLRLSNRWDICLIYLEIYLEMPQIYFPKISTHLHPHSFDVVVSYEYFVWLPCGMLQSMYRLQVVAKGCRRGIKCTHKFYSQHSGLVM